MTNIVDRLRLEALQQKRNGIFPSTVSVLREAADEIVRLRKALAEVAQIAKKEAA